MVDGERKEGFTLIEVINNKLWITCGLTVNKFLQGGGASLSSGLDLPTSGGPLRTKNRNIPEGGIRPTLNIKNLGFSKV